MVLEIVIKIILTNDHGHRNKSNEKRFLTSE